MKHSCPPAPTIFSLSGGKSPIIHRFAGLRAVPLPLFSLSVECGAKKKVRVSLFAADVLSVETEKRGKKKQEK